MAGALSMTHSMRTCAQSTKFSSAHHPLTTPMFRTQAIAISAMLMVANICLMVMIVVDAKVTRVEARRVEWGRNDGRCGRGREKDYGSRIKGGRGDDGSGR